MKRKWCELMSYAVILLAIGWWDFWYPELTKAAGVYDVVYEENTVQLSEEMIECEFNEDTFQSWIKTNGEKIHFRFRIWEWIEEYRNKG